jgi:hypothetical protein
MIVRRKHATQKLREREKLQYSTLSTLTARAYITLLRKNRRLVADEPVEFEK